MAAESVQQLFAKYPVSDIRELEKKTRQEIETKKEDLRQMVGERYRDLIEAADTIADMKKCALNLKDSVQHLQTYTTTKLNTRGASEKKVEDASLSIDSYMQIASQVKLLMEVSETIWSRVESGNMIEATHLYMQSRQVLKNLKLDGSTTYCPVLSWFPVLGQQAQALDNLRSTILSECRTLMKDNKLHTKSLAEALCSIILLENSDLAKAFAEFMSARLSAIQSQFEETAEVGIVKLCRVVTLLAATLKQVHMLFVASVEEEKTSGESGKKRPKLSQNTELNVGLVKRNLIQSHEAFTTKSISDGITESSEEKTWSKHLPASVSDLTTMHPSSTSSIVTSTVINSTSTEWLEKCREIVKTGTLDLLKYITTFKALATLRQSVWDTLYDVTDACDVMGEDPWKLDEAGGAEAISEWEKACMATLGRKLSIWDEILKDLFLSKSKFLSKSSFSDLLSHGKNRLDEALESLKSSSPDGKSTSEFIWLELPGDILPDAAWRQVSVRKSKEVKGGLGLKALTVTPALHDACQQLNSSMRQTIMDLRNYIPESKTSSKMALEQKTSEEQSSSIISEEEKSIICRDFQDACGQCLKDFVALLAGYTSSLTDKLETEKECTEEILFLAMFCRNFCQLCDEFHTGCIIGRNMTEEHPLKRQLSASMTSSIMAQSTQLVTSPVWEDFEAEMMSESNKFLKLWSDVMIGKAMLNFRNSMLDLKSAVHFFDTLPVWDNVKIHEESETGSEVESEIKLPMAVSWPVEELLYCICHHISQIGGHSISRSTLQDITLTLWNDVLHTFMQLRNSIADKNGVVVEIPGSQLFSVTQPWALQRLFDLRVLHGLLYSTQHEKSSGKSVSEVAQSSFSELIDWLESYIDPFDLDVFAPHLTKNVQRSIQCSSVLLGFVVPAEKSDSFQANQAASKTGSNSHNILPLTSDCGRFSYLPISNRMSKPDTVPLPASIKNHLPLSSALKQLTEADKKMEGGRKQSLYSKLGALSSSWLSSMGSDN